MSGGITERRLAVLCASYGRVRRGIETVVRELCLQRLGRDYAIDLYAPPEAPALEAPHRVIRIPCAARTDARAQAYARLLQGTRWPLAGAHEYEVLSFCGGLLDSPFWSESYHAVYNFAGPYAAPLCALKRTWDGSAFVHTGQAGIGPVEVLQAIAAPDLYAPLSPAARDWLAGKGMMAADAAIIPNGVATTAFAPGPALACDLPRPVVLCAGALDAMKRPQLAVEAAARAGMSLLLAGDGELRDEVLALAQQCLGSRWQWLGEVPEEQLPALYNAADVCTLASYEEPFGIVLLEALACNKPVVTQDDAVRRWLVGDAGLLCDCRDAEAYAAALQQALATDWQDRPRQRALAFDWDAVAQAHLSRLRTLQRSN